VTIDDQIKLAKQRTSLWGILNLIANEYVLEVKDILKPNKDLDAIEARQVFIAICYHKLLFTQSEIAKMVGLSQPHTYRNLMLFDEELEFDSEAKEIYTRIIKEI